MLVYALYEIDIGEVVDILTSQNPVLPLAVIALIILQMAISTLRWERLVFLLSGNSTNYTQLFKLNYIGAFFNSCLPGTIGGDVVRTMLLKSERYPLTICIHSVIIDRLIAVLGVVLMVTASLPQLGKLLPSLPVLPMLAVIIICIIAGLFLLAKAPAWLARFPSTHFLRMTIHLLESIKRITFAWRDFLIMSIQAIFAHGCICLSAYLLAQAIGVPMTFGQSLLLIPPVLLLAMLPVSVGGWGVREVSMVGFLALIGVPKEAALTISVQLGILTIIASAPGAWCYLKRQKPEVWGSSVPQ